MPPTNDFVQFCETSTGTNLLTQGDYLTDAQRPIGNQPGVARSKLVNKAMRQATVIASQLAQYIANKTGADILDNGTTDALIGQITSALSFKAPIIRKFTAGTGTFNKSYIFAITAGNATIGATYTNNTFTFTVVATVASAAQVIMTGSGAPSASGTLTKASGTGDATITFHSVAAPLYFKATLVGPGGGGGGGGASGGANGTGAADTTYFRVGASPDLLVAGGGSGGGSWSSNAPGAGGVASLGTGPIGIAVQGGNGCASGFMGTAGNYIPGSTGGGTALSGGGGGGYATNAAVAVAVNSGAGGGGGGNNGGASSGTGAGGGGGGFVQAFIMNPAPVYVYNVGNGGAAGTAGAGGGSGANGADGLIIIEEHFQ